MDEKTWPMIDHCFGDPFSDEIVSAMSCDRAWSAADRRPIAAPRSTGDHVRPRPVVEGLAGGGDGRSASAVEACGT